MELLFGIFLIAVCNAELAYLPPHQAAAAGGHGDEQQLYVNGNYAEEPQYGRAQGGGGYEKNARILKHDSELTAHGYQYAYETENGIRAHESGTSENGVQAQGSYSYTGDDGQVYTISYTADANGFQAQGDHLPTPPPTPEAILKALEQNAKDEAAGISDDGSYREEQQHQSIGNGGAQYYSQSQYTQPAQLGHSAQFSQAAQHAQSAHYSQPAQYSQSAQYSQAAQGGQGYHY